MKAIFLATTALLVATSSAHAAPRKPDPFTDGGRASATQAQIAVRNTSQPLVEEQFRTLAVRKADPYTDGAIRTVDVFTDGA
ncbi:MULTISPECIES: hypothetical protein [Cupriavidus]|uniref:Uncharacterized protein n=1 Tax=Cupriavidus metallidurans TaxID=119219 RepID=A0A2L0X3W8_9BURK|nr:MULTISPECIES: hypothetical protein [Cupriavidus]AVA34735.1 hypothetical protein C3Z06_14705 [Cupriavidus metallidurans]KWR75354.1 hypothetical protein RN01_29705 [Cupriavidus sp. SHE]QBP12223.1 hypothetical protein DDF84_020865 [Cupriavidus metallidurans]QWC92190.1 hypothetical protein KB891_20910 [Cupriavidus metallidurans]